MSSHTNRGAPPHDFLLTPHQQSLLLAALNANKPQPPADSTSKPVTLSPSSFKNSPLNGAGAGAGLGYQESSLLDNHCDFGDSGLDFSLSNDQSPMIGDMPSTSDKSDSPEEETHIKRIHSDDEEEAGDNDPKRRESAGKTPKKPGRKLLTSEPTTKRKAQNRAAQRAFRERKEKHLKDLETKIEELEKASESANHENAMLRAKVERMTAELKQYKQRTTMSAQSKPSPQSRQQSQVPLNSINHVNFQFECPQFGALPGPPASSNTCTSVSQSLRPQNRMQPSSPALSRDSDIKSSQPPATSHFKQDVAKFSNMFPPPIGGSVGNSSRITRDSMPFSFPAVITSSPSTSSNCHVGPSSSCDTSPEPFSQSPMGFKPVDAFGTIGQQQLGITTNPSQQQQQQQQPLANFPNVSFDSNNLDWLTQQSGGHFEPQLFGNYREPQQSVLSNPLFDDLFNDAFDADFFTPYNAAPSTTPSLMMKKMKKKKKKKKKANLIAEIDARQNSVDDEPFIFTSEFKDRKVRELREKLQGCRPAQSDDFDLDGLCNELTMKVRCSAAGPIVGEVDFDTILKKYMGKDAAEPASVASKIGFTIEPQKGDVGGGDEFERIKDGV